MDGQVHALILSILILHLPPALSPHLRPVLSLPLSLLVYLLIKAHRRKENKKSSLTQDGRRYEGI